MIISWEQIIAIAGIILAGDGILKMLIQRKLKKKDRLPEIEKKLDTLSEAVMLSLDAHKVELKALHDGKLNGDGEAMQERLNQFEHSLMEEGLGGHQSEAS